MIMGYAVALCFNQFKVFQFLRMYWRKMDPETPPEVDDGSQEDLQSDKIEKKDKGNDSHNLEERFYRYGNIFE